jgi:hypothetical protein
VKRTVSFLVVLLVLSIVLTSGCGGQKQTKTTGETASTQKALQLKTVGYAKDNPGYTITGILYKPDKSMGAIDSTITVTIYDTSGVIQATHDMRCGIIPPLTESPVYYPYMSTSGTEVPPPAKVDVKTRVATWKKMASKELFTFSNTNVLGDKITGMMTSHLKVTAPKVTILAVFLDQKGNASGGSFQWVDNVLPEQPLPFELNSVGQPTPAQVKYFGDATISLGNTGL